jgi:hypothetical protein
MYKYKQNKLKAEENKEENHLVQFDWGKLHQPSTECNLKERLCVLYTPLHRLG